MPEPSAGGRATAHATPSFTRFVLVRPSHAGNVGAAARAMRVMGFDELVLVEPRHADVLSREETLVRASGAVDVLAKARVVADLAAALEGVQFACATAMTPRDFGPPAFASRALAERIAGAADGPRPSVAFVFGPERFGLANDEVYRCDAVLSIPTDPAYGSLNLAQAVQIVAYDWRQALGGFPVIDRRAPSPRADAAAVDGLLAHWEAVLVRIGFLDPAVPKKLLPRLRRLLLRAEVRTEEVHILRGIARAVSRAVDPAARGGTDGAGEAAAARSGPRGPDLHS